jgi:hypothetical protein
MRIRDWQRVEEYAATAQHDGARWAWEFLRRNPLYQAEWAEFMVTWQALEAAYGRPPNRDFCAWKNDPRAWLAAADCAGGDCRIDGDKVLIECALGARWGFHKFPPDPADDDPVGGGRLSWREVSEDAVLLGQDDQDWLGVDPARVALGFDLRLPLREQLERAKRALQVLQRQRERSGQVSPRSLRRQAPQLQRMLRLLDAEEASADEAALESIAGDWRGLLAQAQALRDGGYRRLPQLPA